jgi:hypothetical protein
MIAAPFQQNLFVRVRGFEVVHARTRVRDSGVTRPPIVQHTSAGPRAVAQWPANEGESDADAV